MFFFFFKLKAKLYSYSTIPSFIQSTTEKIQRDNVTTYDRNETDTNYSMEPTEQIHVENDRTNSTNNLSFSYSSLLGILVLICALGVLVLLFYFRKRKSALFISYQFAMFKCKC